MVKQDEGERAEWARETGWRNTSLLKRKISRALRQLFSVILYFSIFFLRLLFFHLVSLLF